jgi:hypothetical protein
LSTDAPGRKAAKATIVTEVGRLHCNRCGRSTWRSRTRAGKLAKARRAAVCRDGMGDRSGGEARVLRSAG